MHSDEFKERINSLDENDKKITFNYFTKFEAMENLMDIVISKKPLVRESFGNYNAKLVFAVNFKNSNDKIIEIIKKFFNVNKSDFYSAYFTSIDKFEDRALDLKFLNKELAIIAPIRTVVIGDDLILENSKCFSKELLDELLLCFENPERKNNNDLYITARTEFEKCMSFALYGGK